MVRVIIGFDTHRSMFAIAMKNNNGIETIVFTISKTAIAGLIKLVPGRKEVSFTSDVDDETRIEITQLLG